MSVDLSWLEEWCSTNIKNAKADDFRSAQELTLAATAAAGSEGIALGPLVVALGYPSLEDYMFDQLGSRADAAALRRERRARADHTFGRRAHQPDPKARYGFSNDPRRATSRGERLP